jgi:hypothetical protein
MTWLLTETGSPKPNGSTNSLLLVLIPALVTLLGTFLTVAVAWLKDRDQSARRIKKLEEVSRSIEKNRERTRSTPKTSIVEEPQAVDSRR